MQIKSCVQGVLGVKTETNMQIEWQIYSPGQGKVVATVLTTGISSQKVPLSQIQETEGETLRMAFEDNVRRLAASPDLKAALQTRTIVEAGAATNFGDEARISAPGAPSASRPIADAVGSVVLITLGDAYGSGVLVSSDGYILTNEHVVGRAKSVRIRWSDGFETQGEVVRTHVGRDVALIKTDARNREPLSVRLSAPQTGETVLAIGAPVKTDLQGTVTRGVMSANRIVNGYSFIQSDVGVNHGNSGGPLLDDKGYVVGLTDVGLQSNGSPIGLNFFIPIKDALDFLSLDLVAPAANSPPVQKASAPRTGVRKAVR